MLRSHDPRCNGQAPGHRGKAEGLSGAPSAGNSAQWKEVRSAGISIALLADQSLREICRLQTRFAVVVKGADRAEHPLFLRN